MNNYVIKNVTLYDGTGKEGFVSDIAITDDKISQLGEVKGRAKDGVVDGTNLCAMPGAIDILNHSDTHWTIISEPSQESLLRQGITTILGGVCGSSLAPLVDPKILTSIQKWTDVSEANVNWSSVREFLNEIERQQIGVNFGTLVGHGTLRRNVLGEERRESTEEELDKMKLMLKQALVEGAFGLSFGLAYSHEKTSTTNEINNLVSLAGAKKIVSSFHIRDEGKHLLSSIGEIIHIARITGAPVEISHLKAIGRSAWEDFDSSIDMIRKAREEGLLINTDFFPYDRTGSLLYSLLPDWAREGGKDIMLANFKSPEYRKMLIEGIKSLTLHFDKITIASTRKRSSLNGKTLENAAAILGTTPEEAMLELLIVNELTVTIFGNTLNEKHIPILFNEPYTIISSDGIGKSYRQELHKTSNLIHPRSFGTIPRVLGSYVRDMNVIKWEQAIRKMTSLPAEKYGILGRGRIEKNYFADIVLFNPNTVSDKSTYDNPYQAPEGVEWVFINGKPAIQKGAYRGTIEGKVLRKE